MSVSLGTTASNNDGDDVVVVDGVGMDHGFLSAAVCAAMGVAGGGIFPPIQGAIADAANTRISYVVPLVGFCVVLAYVATHWVRHGFHVLRVKGERVVATSLEGGAVGGAVSTVHYDEKRLSVAAQEEIRRGSVGAASVKGVTGGINKY